MDWGFFMPGGFGIGVFS